MYHARLGDIQWQVVCTTTDDAYPPARHRGQTRMACTVGVSCRCDQRLGRPQ